MLKPTQIQPLVQKHLERYSKRLNEAKKGTPGYSLTNAHYLSLWLGIQTKGCDWQKMDAKERQEALDAYHDEST